MRRWREENPEEWEAWKSEYYERNKARYAEHCSKRVAVLRGAAFVERVAKKKLREMDGDRCAYCEVDLSFAPKRRGEWRADAAEVDHVIPVSAGGMHSYANTALACAKCNREKGSSTRWNLTAGHRLAQTTGG